MYRNIYNNNVIVRIYVHYEGRDYMNKYHVGCGLAGIYAGVLNPKNQSEWKDKSECTNQAIVAVRDYMERLVVICGI